MRNLITPFKCVHCKVLKEGDSEPTFPELPETGFVLVDDDHLVSFSFLNRLIENIGSTYIKYDDVQHVGEVPTYPLWGELSHDERAVLGPCLLFLIQEKYIAVIHWEKESEEDTVQQEHTK